MMLIHCRQRLATFVVALLATSCMTQPDADWSTFTERVFRGSIAESAASGDEVLLNIPLSLTSRDGLVGDEICGYTVYKWRSDLPFKVVLLDRRTGDAKIVLAEGARLDYEEKHKYSFDVAAYDCQTGTHAPRERVNVYVDDVNEFSPVWEKQQYSAVVDETTQHKDIIQIAATDADGSPGMSKICQYHVVTPGVPFEVDELGYVRNTEPLDARRTDFYSFQVQAEDCGGRVSADATVHVQVNPVCRRGLSGVSDVEVRNGGPRVLMPNAELGVCDVTCKPERVSVTSRLQTSLIGRGCDRQPLSLREHRQLCGASRDYINLLPDPAGDDAWTTYMPTVEDIGDDPIFAFDGQSTAVEVPRSVVDPDSLGTSFTISTWMKRDREDNDGKQQVVCAADGEGMNRHHYGLFVHKCRLVLLLRRQPTTSSDNTYTSDVLGPAEWRWNLPETCDRKWHHYVVSVDSAQQVTLHLDGRLYVPIGSEPEVLDDWPLHRAKQVHSTRLYVGACWQGARGRPGQYLRGQLAGLVLTTNTTDSDDAIDCLNICQEKLELSGTDFVDNGMSVSMNAAMNMMTINGRDVDSVQKVLRQLIYVNNRLFPTPASRPLSVETHVQCADGRQPTFDVVNLSVDVMRTDTVLLQLAATAILERDQQHLLVGDKLFFDLVITASQAKNDMKYYDYQHKEEKGVSDVTERVRLDPCHVHVEPPMKPEVEQLTYPADLAESLDLDVAVGESGLTISGAGSVYDYQSVLRQIRYVNTNPDGINRRTFMLSCTEAGKHVASNLLGVNVDVIRTVPRTAAAPNHAMKEVKPILTHKLSLGKAMPSGLLYDNQQTGVGVVVVMLVCVGFIVSLIILGVMRVRNAKHCGGGNGEVLDEKQDLDWDNSALTVTVNPMHPDNVDKYDEDEDDDDDGCDDEDDSDDDCDSDDAGIIYRSADVEAGAPCSHKLQHCTWHSATGGGSTLIL